VASVYHKPADTFVRMRKTGSHMKKSQNAARNTEEDEPPIEHLSINDVAPPVDLLGLGEISQPQQRPAPVQSSPVAAAPPASVGSSDGSDRTPPKVVLAPEQGQGMSISASYIKSGDQLFLELLIGNQSPAPIGQFALQLNVNMLGIALGAQLNVPNPVNPGQSTVARIPLVFGPAPANAPLSPFLQVAIKNNIQIFYFQDVIPFRLLLSAAGKLERAEFLEKWKSLPDSSEVSSELPAVRTSDPNAIQQFLSQNNIFPIAVRTLPDKNVLYLSSCFDSAILLSELVFLNGASGCKISVKSGDNAKAAKMIQIYTALLSPPTQR
jgi:AP-1 complex subunit beta-1